MWEEVFDDGDAIDKIVEIDLFDERNSIRADELANKSIPYTLPLRHLGLNLFNSL